MKRKTSAASHALLSLHSDLKYISSKEIVDKFQLQDYHHYC